MITINLQNPTPEEVDALRDIFSEQETDVCMYAESINKRIDDLEQRDPIKMFNELYKKMGDKNDGLNKKTKK